MTAFNPNKKRFLGLPMLFFQVLGISQNKNENMDYTTGVFVGSTNRTITDKKNDLSFPVLVQYPTLENPRPTRFGPYTMDVAIDAEVMKGEFPLVLISHGNSGSHLLYRTISTFLAKKGFVVAMIEHYGNNRHNNELEKSELNLQYRPAHISLTIDGLVSDKVIGEYISTKGNVLEVFLPGKVASMIVKRADVVQDEKPDVHELAMGKLVLGEDST